MVKHSSQSDDSIQADKLTTVSPLARIPWWVSTIVILGALLTAVGAIISKVVPTMLTNNNPMTDAARVYADYMFARNIPLALALLFLLAIKSRRMLAGFMVLTALIQIVDIINDLFRGAFVLVPGLLLFAIVFLFGASKLFGQPFWHAATWRDR